MAAPLHRFDCHRSLKTAHEWTAKEKRRLGLMSHFRPLRGRLTHVDGAGIRQRRPAPPSSTWLLLWPGADSWAARIRFLRSPVLVLHPSTWPCWQPHRSQHRTGHSRATGSRKVKERKRERGSPHSSRSSKVSSKDLKRPFPSSHGDDRRQAAATAAVFLLLCLAALFLFRRQKKGASSA